MVLAQYPMRQCAMSQKLYGAVEVTFQPFAGNARIGMIIQRFVDAGNGFYLLQYCAYVVADEYDGAIFVDFGQ